MRLDEGGVEEFAEGREHDKLAEFFRVWKDRQGGTPNEKEGR